jgi:hypothetical protein
MGRKPVLALAGALATTMALAGCQTTSNSRPLTSPLSNAFVQPKTPSNPQAFNSLPANQTSQNTVGLGSSQGFTGNGQLQPSSQVTPGLTGQANLNSSPAVQPNQFIVPPNPAPVQPVSSRPMQSSNLGMQQPAMAPGGLGTAMPSSAGFNGSSVSQPGTGLSNAGSTSFNQSSNLGSSQPATNMPLLRDPSALNVPTGPVGPSLNSSTRVTVPDMSLPPSPPGVPMREVPGPSFQ